MTTGVLEGAFGHRLRATTVYLETRKALLRHESGDVTTRYSVAELRELAEAVVRVADIRSGSHFD